MHRLFTAAAILVSAALVSLSADAGGPHVRVFSGSETAAADDGHKDWINLNKVAMIRWAPGAESRNVRVRGSIPASGLPTGKRQHKPITVIKPIDKASPLLARAAKTGQPLPSVILIAPNPDPQSAKRQPYMRVELKDVRVVSYQINGSGQESVRLNYPKVIIH